MIPWVWTLQHLMLRPPWGAGGRSDTAGSFTAPHLCIFVLLCLEYSTFCVSVQFLPIYQDSQQTHFSYETFPFIPSCPGTDRSRFFGSHKYLFFSVNIYHTASSFLLGFVFLWYSMNPFRAGLCLCLSLSLSLFSWPLLHGHELGVSINKLWVNEWTSK